MQKNHNFRTTLLMLQLALIANYHKSKISQLEANIFLSKTLTRNSTQICAVQCKFSSDVIGLIRRVCMLSTREHFHFLIVSFLSIILQIHVQPKAAEQSVNGRLNRYFHFPSFNNHFHFSANRRGPVRRRRRRKCESGSERARFLRLQAWQVCHG